MAWGGDELLSGFIEMEELVVALTRALNDTCHGAVDVTSITSIHEGLLSRWPSEGRKVRVASGGVDWEGDELWSVLSSWRGALWRD